MATLDQLHEAYRMGYTEAEDGYPEVKEEMREYAEEVDEGQAVHDLWMNDGLSHKVHSGSCGAAQDLGDDSQGDREDLDSAFDAGAIDAIFGHEFDETAVDHLA